MLMCFGYTAYVPAKVQMYARLAQAVYLRVNEFRSCS